MPFKRDLGVAIIGAGMSGICMAAKLQDAGIDSFTTFEKADDVGGTWRDNTYPGLTCDVRSRYCSYSFRPNPDWSHMLPPGPEIQTYVEQVADERGIRPLEGRWWWRRDVGGKMVRFVVCRKGVRHVIAARDDDMLMLQRVAPQVGLAGMVTTVLGSGRGAALHPPAHPAPVGSAA